MTGRRLQPTEESIMARLDTDAAHMTDDVFALADSRAKSSAEQRAIETERTLEIIYQLRLARRRSSVFSGTSTPAVLRMAGWE
jgi:hypothetical protein